MRISTVFDKVSVATQAAKRRASLSNREDDAALLLRVRDAFDHIMGKSTDALVAANWAEALQRVLEDDQLILSEYADAFVTIELAAVATAMTATIDAFAAYTKRFVPWAQQRKLLSDKAVVLDAGALS